MRLKLNLLQQQKILPETGAKVFCGKIRKIFWLESATYNPESIRNARTQIHGLRDKYHRCRGDGFGSHVVCHADRVCQKVAHIVNLNPEAWNNYRRGQQFRRLDERLLRFEIESEKGSEPFNAKTSEKGSERSEPFNAVSLLAIPPPVESVDVPCGSGRP